MCMNDVHAFMHTACVSCFGTVQYQNTSGVSHTIVLSRCVMERRSATKGLEAVKTGAAGAMPGLKGTMHTVRFLRYARYERYVLQ